MKTKEEITGIVKQYLKERRREYSKLDEDKIFFNENKKIVPQARAPLLAHSMDKSK